MITINFEISHHFNAIPNSSDRYYRAYDNDSATNGIQLDVIQKNKVVHSVQGLDSIRQYYREACAEAIK